jgi:hypothetical protein
MVPANLQEYFSPLCLAIWFMDDGCKVHNTVSISVHSYSEDDIGRLKNLLSAFGVHTKVHFDGHGSRLYIPTSDYLTFKKLVKPFVESVPCMAYKLP